MRRVVPSICGLLAVVLIGPRDARADRLEIERALGLYEDGRLTEALAELERVLRGGGLSRTELVVVHGHLGVLRAGSGDAAGARSAFAVALDLDPAVVPPGDASPLVQVPFEEARRARGRSPPLRLEVLAPGRCVVGSRCVATARVQGDTTGVGQAIALHVVGGGRSVLPGPLPLEITLPTPAAGELRTFAELLDAHGSVLASDGSASEPAITSVARVTRRSAPAAAVRAGVPRAPRRRDGTSALSSPWLWVGVGVAIVGAASAAALLASPGSGRASLHPVEVEVR